MLTAHLDIQAPLSQAVLRLLAGSVDSSREGAQRQHEDLLRLASLDADGYGEWARRDRHNSLLDTLERFAAAQPDCARLFALLPRLQPRMYSLASDPQRTGAPREECEGEALSAGCVAVSLLATLQRLPSGRLGVCSDLLCRLKPGRDALKVFGRSSRSKQPTDPRTPLLLVAAGSGLAPFLGFLERREAALAAGGAGEGGGQAIGEAHLYFGCRTAPEVPFREQLDAWARGGRVLTTCSLALSRKEAPSRPAYVQALIAADATRIVDLVLEREAAVYVCGSGAMAAGVREAFVCAFQACSAAHGDEPSARALLQELQQSGQYQQDVWG
jgi:sulfite reductase alpha subunit-like flavoprotein